MHTKCGKGDDENGFCISTKRSDKSKNKIILNLTKRQLICLGIAAAVGLPFYFLSRELIGSSNAATGMCLLMLPAFYLLCMRKMDFL